MLLVGPFAENTASAGTAQAGAIVLLRTGTREDCNVPAKVEVTQFVMSWLQ